MSDAPKAGASASSAEVEVKLADMKLEKDADGFFTVAPTSNTRTADPATNSGNELPNHAIFRAKMTLLEFRSRRETREVRSTNRCDP